MPWLSQQSDCLKPKQSGEEILSTRGHLRTLPTSNTRPWAGSTGTTTAACTHPWTTCHPSNSNLTTTLETWHPNRRCHTHEDGRKTQTIHLDAHSGEGSTF